MTARGIVVDALAARRGGTAYAAVQVARHLVRIPAVGGVQVLTRRGSLVDEGLAEDSAVVVTRLAAAGRFELVRRAAWEGAVLPGIAGRRPLLTWSGMLPRTPAGPVTAYLANPVAFQATGAGNRLRRWAIARTARNATEVIAPTRAQADLVAPVIGRYPHVVPLGIDHERLRPGTGTRSDILSIGDFYPHKRHDLVFAAWTGLDSPRPRLRIIGDPAPDRRSHAGLVGVTARERAAGHVAIESRLGLKAVVAAYQRAKVVVVASEREAFGLPVLEAQACGAVVVARDLPALREVGGEGAVYVAGSQPADWRAAIRRAIDDADGDRSLVERGYRNAALYSWSRTASELAERML